MMEILLITGFLGAGKTTLIRHLLKSKFSAAQKIAMIVNEIGEIGIDGTLLSGQDVDILELTSGCICCTIKTDFFKAVQQIYRTVNPSHLIVETTGVAQPGDMFDVLFEPPLSDFCRLKRVITVVDAGFFEAREVLGAFYDNQLQCADILVLNKIDQVESTRLEQIKAVLYGLNPYAAVIPAQFGAVEPAVLVEKSAGDSHPQRPPINHFGHADEAGFQTFYFEDERPLDKQRLVSFLDTLPPNLFRCKGWVRFENGSVLLNYTGGRYRLEPDEAPHNTALVFVGRKCDDRQILKELAACLCR